MAPRVRKSGLKKGPFACQADSSCSSTFSRDADRVRHEKSVHRKGRIFICGTRGCEYSQRSNPFYRQDHLTQHIRHTGHIRGQSLDPEDAEATGILNEEDIGGHIEKSSGGARKRAREDSEAPTTTSTAAEEKMSSDEVKALLERQEKQLRLEMEEREEEWKSRATKMEFKYKKLEMEMEDLAAENAKLKRLVWNPETKDARKVQ